MPLRLSKGNRQIEQRKERDKALMVQSDDNTSDGSEGVENIRRGSIPVEYPVENRPRHVMSHRRAVSYRASQKRSNASRPVAKSHYRNPRKRPRVLVEGSDPEIVSEDISNQPLPASRPKRKTRRTRRY